MNDRCEKHGVTRCMLCRAKAQTVSAQPVESDPQAQEAAARIADTSPVDVDFGDVEAAWSGDTCISVSGHVGEVVARIVPGLTADEPPVRLAPKGTHLAGNPIVDAAAAYTSAQEKVQTYLTDVVRLEDELSSVRVRLEEAKGDRDVKKQVLTALVGGAS